MSVAPIRLWLDDIRRPPDESWAWARTNAEARDVLAAGVVVEASLDHDLGLHDADPDLPDADLQRLPDGMRPEEGWELVEWMLANDRVPARIAIHSWNPDGARRMARLLADAGHHVTVKPYQRPGEGTYP